MSIIEFAEPRFWRAISGRLCPKAVIEPSKIHDASRVVLALIAVPSAGVVGPECLSALPADVDALFRAECGSQQRHEMVGGSPIRHDVDGRGINAVITIVERFLFQ